MTAVKDEREHLGTLLHSPGWAIFTQAIHAEWEVQFSHYVRKAADDREDATALQKLRQVLAAKEAIARMVAWPSDRLAQLDRQEAAQPVTSFSRRGAGL